jgi:amidohydrolase
MPNYLSEAESLFPYTQTLRRDFHQHPELGFQEVRTAGIVARELRDLGLEVSTGIAETGVVAIIEGGKSGPVALLRFTWTPSPSTKKPARPMPRKPPASCTPAGMTGTPPSASPSPGC